jgi:two-component system sensor histidine kinase CreC
MNLSVRIFLAYFALVGIAVWFVMQSFNAELVPGMRQSLEEVLVDTANLLAEIVKEEVVQGTVNDGEFASDMNAFSLRNIDAVIWFLKKRDPNLIVYITDASGTVLYDSRGRDTGKDYSSWNDVYLTLKGEYGARTTREDPNDEFSSIMYVAAPVAFDGRIVGVLTVGKPSITVQPFVEAAAQNVREKGIWLLLISLVLGLFLAWWLTLSIRRLTRYAHDVQQGERVQVPILREKELAQLAGAMEGMRTELEGRHYVENYLHTLTHEMKSPLAAIQGAAELLDEEMPRDKRQRFIDNIRNESNRLREVVDHLLNLASVEKRRGLEQVERISLGSLVDSLCADKSPMLAKKNLTAKIDIDVSCSVEGERFLLQQAISNLLDNAIEFSPTGAAIEINASREQEAWNLGIRDHGPGIPDYARDRLFERFYSMPRPDSGRKGTGLGLSLVREVAQLHGGDIVVENHPEGGALARLMLPAQQMHIETAD